MVLKRAFNGGPGIPVTVPPIACGEHLAPDGGGGLSTTLSPVEHLASMNLNIPAVGSAFSIDVRASACCLAPEE